ncbi:uncharacterized protein LOC131301366 isoform X3 [Rhododendron vialii]|uniref:uncharacterized protein LOC131301366 isoform X3 n=1 Tax=Rhododendron vialii TaxID=182163 RepID=UPI0026603124|nr:uncharacterized protein LOC131301366 isoform X3 [Rhododendron vialii]
MTSSHFEGKDIISDLPRNIIESILQRMPVRDAARTSILSSKWSGIGHLNIHARNLELLVLNRNNGIESLSFVDTPKLWWCSISLGMKMESLLRSKTPSSLDFLVDLPRVSILHLDSFFLQLLTADGGLRSLPTRFTLLQSLSFYTMTFSDVVVISCTLLLIQSCPNLMELNIRFCPTTNTFEELVVNYLEAPACMDQSEQTLAKLISVKINCLKGLKPQLLLIKLLLACSPKLETLFVGLSSRLNESEGFKISKELSQFRRLSPKAAVIY